MGKKVFDGTETFTKVFNTEAGNAYSSEISDMTTGYLTSGYCSHFKVIVRGAENVYQTGVWIGYGKSVAYFIQLGAEFDTVEKWKAEVARQNTAGTPIELVYSLAEPTETDLPLTPVSSSTAPELPVETIEWIDQSPDYPGQIVTAGDLSVEGKNLLDPGLLYDQPSRYSWDNGVFTTTGGASYATLMQKINCEKVFETGNVYHLKCHCKILSISDGTEHPSYGLIGLRLYNFTKGKSVIENTQIVSQDDFIVGKEFNLTGSGAITDELWTTGDRVELLLYNPLGADGERRSSIEATDVMISKVDAPYIPYMGRSSAQLPTMYRYQNNEGNIEIAGEKYLSDFVELRKINGSIKAILTHKTGHRVLDGTERWGVYTNAQAGNAFYFTLPEVSTATKNGGLCTHFAVYKSITYKTGVWFGAGNHAAYFIKLPEAFDTLDKWKAEVTRQHTAGTPIEIVYSLAEPREEDITDTPEGQSLIAARTIPLHTRIYSPDDVKPYMDISIRTVGVMDMWDFIVKYWIDALFTGSLAVAGVLLRSMYKQIKADRTEKVLMKDGLLAILHDRLYQECNRLIAQDWCAVEDMRNLEYMYKSYHSLGGNGTGTELYERCKKLHIRTNKF